MFGVKANTAWGGGEGRAQTLLHLVKGASARGNGGVLGEFISTTPVIPLADPALGPAEGRRRSLTS